jgi:hypothetical protein
MDMRVIGVDVTVLVGILAVAGALEAGCGSTTGGSSSQCVSLCQELEACSGCACAPAPCTCTPSPPKDCNALCGGISAAGCSPQLDALASCIGGSNACTATACAPQSDAIDACLKPYCVANPTSAPCK